MVVLGQDSGSLASHEILIPLEYYFEDIMSFSGLSQICPPSTEIGQSIRNNGEKFKTFLSSKIEGRKKPSASRAWNVDWTALAQWVANSETLRRYLASDRVLHHYFPDLEDNPFADCHGEEWFSPFFENLLKGLDNHKIYEHGSLCPDCSEAHKRHSSEVVVPIILQRGGSWNRLSDPEPSERLRTVNTTTSDRDSVGSESSLRTKFAPSSMIDFMTLSREKMGYGKFTKPNDEPRILTEEEEIERIRNEELAKVGMRIDNSWRREGNVVMGVNDIQVANRSRFDWA